MTDHELYEIYKKQYMKRVRDAEKYGSSQRRVKALEEMIVKERHIDDAIRELAQEIKGAGGRPSSKPKLALQLANKQTRNIKPKQAKALQRAYEHQYERKIEIYQQQVEVWETEDRATRGPKPQKPKKKIPGYYELLYGEDTEIYDLIRALRKQLSEDPEFTGDMQEVIDAEIFGS